MDLRIRGFAIFFMKERERIFFYTWHSESFKPKQTTAIIFFKQKRFYTGPENK